MVIMLKTVIYTFPIGGGMECRDKVLHTLKLNDHD